MGVRSFLLIFFAAMTTFSQMPKIEPGVPLDLAKWRAARYSDVRYKLDLKLEKMSPVLKGTIEIRVNVDPTDGTPVIGGPTTTARDAGSKTDIVFDWRRIKGKEDLSTVSNITLNGSPAIFEDASEHIVIKDAPPGENTVTLDFTSPILTSGSAITRYVDRQDQGEYIYSLFVPSDASTAFPVFDQPDLKVRFTLSIKAPQDWKIVSNSRPNAVQQLPITHTEDWKNKVMIIQFEETKPISTYVFAFAAGDFEKFEEIDLDGKKKVIMRSPANGTLAEQPLDPGQTRLDTDVYVRRSQAEKFKLHAAEVFRLNGEGVKFLESYFDYKYPFSKYDLVLIPEFPFGGMEHAGATFLREESIIFPQEPTANNYISRANLIFHEAAHQWFGDTVTMRWFDDLWLKEGFAEFMAYKTLEKVMPEYNAWKIFYERNKQAAYLTDSTKGTTPIYQEIPNLSAAKSAYGNIVYRKAPSFLRQAEFYIGVDKFQTAVRVFLKKYEFKNAEWKDLVSEFNKVYSRRGLPEWAGYWVKQPGVPTVRTGITEGHYERSEPVSADGSWSSSSWMVPALGLTLSPPFDDSLWALRIKTLYRYGQEIEVTDNLVSGNPYTDYLPRLFDKSRGFNRHHPLPDLIFPNYQDYGYGIFLMDEKSKKYVLENIQNEKDDFLRTMMWGSLWDSVREAELDPNAYVELVIKKLGTEKDETTVSTLLGRVSTATNYYISNAQRDSFAPRLEELLLERLKNAVVMGQKLTFYRAFLNVASSPAALKTLKEILKTGMEKPPVKEGITRAIPANPALFGLPPLKTKDKFDIITRLIILGDKEAEILLAELEKIETSDEAKRYAYAARAGIVTKENKAKFFNDFINNKEISESWIEAAFGTFNSVRHSSLTLPYLERALAELPNLKRNRKIFFVNGWLGAFIGGQRNAHAFYTVEKFLEENPNLDRDLRLKVLENLDLLERASKIQRKFPDRWLPPKPGQTVSRPPDPRSGLED